VCIWNCYNKNKGKLTKINEEFLVNSMLTTLGPLATINVLIDIHQHSSAKNVRFDMPPHLFGKILREGKVWLKKKRLIHDALETTDAYLYPTKPLAMAPQFLAVHNVECQNPKGITKSTVNEFPFVTPSSSSSSGYDLTFDYNSPLPRFFEEANTHWGIQVDLGSARCAVCSLPLTEKLGTYVVVMGTNQKCGHAFHERCLPVSDMCPVCFAKNIVFFSHFLTATASD
jgi:hypothetical protein